MLQVNIIISGIVQGVGFRQFVKNHAQKLGIYGWVRNNSDGTVEVLALGEKDDLLQLISICRKGPLVSDVKVVDFTFDKVNEAFITFFIK